MISAITKKYDHPTSWRKEKTDLFFLLETKHILKLKIGEAKIQNNNKQNFYGHFGIFRSKQERRLVAHSIARNPGLPDNLCASIRVRNR